MKHVCFTRIAGWIAFGSFFYFSGPALAQSTTPEVKRADRIYQEADSLFDLQQDSMALLKYQQATRLYVKHHSIGPNLVDACMGTGILYQILEQFEPAIAAYKEAIRFQEKIKPQADSSYFYPFILVASCYIHLNQYDAAYAWYARAEPLLTRFPRITQAQRFYNEMGFLFDAFGNYTQSINYYEKALKTLHFDPQAVIQPDSFKVIRYVMYNSNIARSLSKLGLYRQAIDKTRGLIRFGIIPHILYQNMAAAYLQVEQPDSAAIYLRKINIGAVAAGNAINPNKASVEYYNSLGQVYLQKKDSRQALACFNRSRQLSMQHFPSKNNLLAMAYAGKGQVYAAQYIFGQALRNYQSALQALHFTFKDADIYHNPADLNNAVSPLLLFKVLGYKAQAFRQYYGRTREVKDLTAALHTYQLAFRLSDLIRKGYDSDETKLFFANTVSPLYEEAIATAFQLFVQTRQPRDLETAFALAEQSKAAVLAESLRELKIRQVPGIPAALLQEERGLKRNMAALNQKLADENDPRRKEGYRDDLREIEIKLAKTLKEFEKSKAYYQLKYDTSPIRIGDIQEKLNKHTALVEYFVGRQKLFVFVITSDGFQAQELGLTAAFNRSWHALYAALYRSEPGRPYAGDAPAYHLYRQLLAPLAPILAGRQRLIIVPDKELGYLPFEALVSQSATPRYLLQDYTISYAYSARLLEATGGSNWPGRGASILAMAPYARQAAAAAGDNRELLTGPDRLSPLYASGGEVSQIGGQVYLGAAATKQQLLAQASQFDIIHLATHARADIRQPLHSFIAFYPQAGQANGFRLYVPEIYNLQLSKLKLVVLSACETGGGQLVKGEGIMSLARAFAYAGCPSTVTTLWQAEDKTSAYISARLYGHLKAGKPKDVALRLAKLDYLESQTNWRRRSPVYWANFIFIGDQAPLYTNYAWLWWGVGGLLTAAAGWLAYKKWWVKNAMP